MKTLKVGNLRITKNLGWFGIEILLSAGELYDDVQG